jgi:hypothetical protein
VILNERAKAQSLGATPLSSLRAAPDAELIGAVAPLGALRMYVVDEDEIRRMRARTAQFEHQEGLALGDLANESDLHEAVAYLEEGEGEVKEVIPAVMATLERLGLQSPGELAKVKEGFLLPVLSGVSAAAKVVEFRAAEFDVIVWACELFLSAYPEGQPSELVEELRKELAV